MVKNPVLIFMFLQMCSEWSQDIEQRLQWALKTMRVMRRITLDSVLAKMIKREFSPQAQEEIQVK